MTENKQICRPQFEYVDDCFLARAPAKINLYLLIADRRPDGFHNLETLMAKINFYDELIFEITTDKKIQLICEGLWSPQSKENIVYRAAEMFYARLGKDAGIKITLKKNIPAGSGLGGASSDAAAAVMAMNKLYDEPLSYEQMHEICADLGSDVPFFLGPPAAICTGRGEKIAQINKKLSFLALLILPNISVSTKEVYDNFKPDLPLFHSLKEQIKPLILKNRVDLVQKMCANMLAEACFVSEGRLAGLKEKIEALCKLPLSLSGSGAAFFAVVENRDCQKAELYQRAIIDAFDCNCIIVSNNRW